MHTFLSFSPKKLQFAFLVVGVRYP